ncbi:MAG: DUF1501 domain-containing protein, partial [Deltaproteobacteria bacterium]
MVARYVWMTISAYIRHFPLLCRSGTKERLLLFMLPAHRIQVGLMSTHKTTWKPQHQDTGKLLEVLPGARSATEAVSLGPTLPRILSGPAAATNIALNQAGTRPTPLDRPEIQAAFDRLYKGNDPLSVAYREGEAARKKLLAELTEEMTMANQGAPSPVGFADEAQKLGRLIARDSTIKVAFLALGGWDTHINQGSVSGQLPNRLKALSETLATFVQALGTTYSDTVILVMSEFGRTVHENGNTGTDHGHGNVMWVMGGNVRGGKVYGQWPGLSGNEL